MRGTSARSTRQARRAQVIQAYIEVVAAEGYDAATFARLTERAEMSSTRMISYHFNSKDDLVAAAVAAIYARIETHLRRGAGVASLGDYIHAAVALNADLAPEMRALTATFLNHRPKSGEPVYGEENEAGAVGRVRAIVQAGQRDGTIRADLDPSVVAVTVQRSIDALPFTLQVQPDLDLGRWAEQLVSLFERGTRP